MNEISNQKSADIPTQNNVRRWLTPRSSENVDKPHPFLTIFPHGEATIAHIDPLNKTSLVPCKSFQMPEEISQLEEWVLAANTSGRNCYFHANAGGMKDRRYSKSTVTTARFIWADIDPDITKHGGYLAARAYLLNHLLPLLKEAASVIIDSGNGLQALFRLSEPVDISKQMDKDEYEILNRAVAKKFAGDSTQDCSRILRVPNTTNYPNASKLSKGYPPTPNQSSILHNSNKAYTLDSIKTTLLITDEDLEIAKSEHSKTSNSKVKLEKIAPAIFDSALANRFNSFLESNPNAKARFYGCKDGLTDKSGSAMDMSLATSMLKAGFMMSEIKSLLIGWSYGSMNNDRTGDRYWNNIRQNSYSRDYEITQEKRDAFWALMGGAQPNDQKITLTPRSTEQTKSPEAPVPLNPIEIVNDQYAWDCYAREIYDIKNGLYVQAAKFCLHFDNVQYKPSDGAKLQSLGRAWLRHPARRNVTRLVLAPGSPQVLPNGSLNTWQGYSVDPVAGDITPYLRLMEFVIPNEFERRYISLWLAKLIQNPGAKFLVSLVVWSIEEGVGKGLLFETIGSLLNDRHYKVVGNEVFNDQFTEWQSQKVFVIADEVSSADKRSTADRIKGWITATHNNINVKNTAKFSEPNLIKYVFLSNHPDAVYLNNKDRRFFVSEGPDKKLPKDILQQFITWSEKGGRNALLHHLLSVDTGGFNPTSPAPMSLSKNNMLESNKSDLEQWVENTMLSASSKAKFLVSSEELATKYNLGIHPTRCSGKTIATILKRLGYKKLDKKAKLYDGSRRGLFVPTSEIEKYAEMSETELGKAYGDQGIG